jgi:hypothetical protein
MRLPTLLDRLRRSDDAGAILIFGLIIVTTISLVTGVLLAKGSNNFIATVKLRDVAGKAYAADAAAKVAINDLVYGGSSTVPTTSGGGSNPPGSCAGSGGVACYPNGPAGTPASWIYDNNTDGTGCFGKSTASGNPALDRITLPSIYPATSSASAQTATVVCTPVNGTGLFGTGGGVVVVDPNATDPFARALTTVGTTACTLQGTGTGCDSGITLKGLGSGTEIPVRGSIESKTTINPVAGTLRTNGTIVAVGGCTGPTIPACATSPFVTPTTPSSPLSAVPAWVNPATQGCDFHPGFYNNGAALSAAVNACSTAHFLSGQYYFDFADGQPWDIGPNNGTLTLIGGELAGGSSIPGKCVSPIDNPSTPGVQFVFGGNSYVQVEDNARVELCGPSNGGAAPLTIFQQQSGTTPATQTISAVASSNVTTVTGGKNDGFTTTPGSATLTAALAGTTAPNSTAGWKSTKNGNTGELDLQNFPGLSGIPVGATITDAQLNVTYTSGLTAGGTFKANVSGQPAASAVPVAASGANTDITALVNAQFQSSATGFSNTNPTVQLQLANSAKNDTFTVDAVTLTVKYVPAALRAPTTPATFITDHGGNFAGKFVVQGATYAPKGYITLTPGSNPDALVAFRWGIVAWGVNFKSLPSQVWGYPLVSIPDISFGFGSAVTAVDLKVFVCTGSGPCATTGTPALTSRVQLTDGTNSVGVVNPIAGQRQVNVLSWAEQR